LSEINPEDDICFMPNEQFKTTSDQVCSGIASSSADNCMPQWIGSTQESVCDWELSQWPSTNANKGTLPTQRESLRLNCPFFLRPRNEHTVESDLSRINVEDLQFTEVNKTSRLQSRLQNQMPVVSEPKVVQCSSFKQLDGAYKIPEFHQQNGILPESSSRFSYICPNKLQAGNIEEEIFEEYNEKVNNCFEPTAERPSKWTKYESVSHGSVAKNTREKNKNEDFCPQSVFGKEPQGMENQQDSGMDPTCVAPPTLRGNHSNNDTGLRFELLSKHLTTTKRIPYQLVNKGLQTGIAENGQMSLSCDLCFPKRETVLSVSVPKRKLRIPVAFQSAAQYKQVFTASLTEHLNIMMFELSQRLHKAFSKADISFYSSPSEEEYHDNTSNTPHCLHQQPAKLLMVKKEGPNKGRFFYTCDAPKADQCKFFKWMEEVKCTNQALGPSDHKTVMRDMKSLSSYIRCQNIALYEESQIIFRKISGFHRRQLGKFKKIVNADSTFGDESKTKIYLKLSRKGSSSTYNKDDLWVISKTLHFEPLDTFIACSVFFGPSANNDIEIFPLKGYHPSNWPSNSVVHALLVCNASAELTSLRNIQEHFNPSTLPLMPRLLEMNSKPANLGKVTRGRFNPPNLIAKVSHKHRLPDSDFVLDLSVSMIRQFSLNEDQAAALMKIAQMMTAADAHPEPQPQPITIIHGVFGAGKSYLLAVVVLFLVQIFENTDQDVGSGLSPWKILISSSTNVAVDRVLLGLLDLKFDQFIRVGSVRKIAKPVLPYSLHAGSDNESEQLKELQALLKDDLTAIEKAYVRKSIEQHKLGTNKTLLGQVRVVGVTCAACPFNCLSNLKFPIVILDECSQMTEPASMLPIARFQCEKLILVGDPKQLSPTIQGSEAAHDCGLEQTIFDRLCKMGHKAILLKTQYRCHPAISSVANELFYEGRLLNGLSEEDRKPLLDWLPTLCFYNANGNEMVEGSNSFHNVEEANFTVKLIQSLLASGIQGTMIGVITLYKAQMYKVCTLLSTAALCDPMEVKAVQVSTVDAFQGAEKEVIILSCVRSKQVGFIDSEKRMNVALTRGKRHLLIVGNLACLRKNTLWEHVIHHCERQKDGLTHVSQWEEKLNGILTCYQDKKLEEDTHVLKKKSKPKDGTATLKKT
ncbi:ZGRF1 isoform X1, partial [Pelobates cultripes]